MRRRSQSNALGNGVVNAEQLQHRFSQNIAHHAGDDNGNHRDGHIAAHLLGHAHANSGGDGFGQEGHILAVVKPEHQGKHQHQHHRGQHPGKHAGKNRHCILFQQLQLLIQRDGKAHRGRGQQEADIAGAGLIYFRRNPRHRQESHHQDNRHQQGIENANLPLFLAENAHFIGSKGNRRAKEHGLGCKLRHESSPSRQCAVSRALQRP